MMKLKISNNGAYAFALVDDEDFNKVSKCSWFIRGNRILGRINGGHTNKVQLNRVIANMGSDGQVRYKDGNFLNNTKDNLLIIKANEIIEYEYYCEITIHSKTFGTLNGYFDKEDLDKVSKYNWCICQRKNTKYLVSYIGSRKQRKVLYMHQLVMNCNSMIDHKDGNGLNNRKNNLRKATAAENSYNRVKSSKNSTGYKGVYKLSKNCHGNKRYWACLSANKKRYSGGMFDTAKEAALKYNELAIQHHKEFAKLNEIK